MPILVIIGIGVGSIVAIYCGKKLYDRFHEEPLPIYPLPTESYQYCFSSDDDDDDETVFQPPY